MENETKAARRRSKAVLQLEVPPISHGFVAEAHSPVYKIHRYFARRPFSVFRELIQHYSNARSIILDPFCGGGVTVVEGLRLRRKVVGIDLNPLATFITEMEATDFREDLLLKLHSTIQAAAMEQIQRLYATTCPKCLSRTPFYWMDWGYLFECPNCKKTVETNTMDKKGSGRFVCNNCEKGFEPIEARKMGEVPFQMEVRCRNCATTSHKRPDPDDLKLIDDISKGFKTTIEKNGLWYPDDSFPDGDRARDDAIFQKGIKSFADFFTLRNLTALAILFREVKSHAETIEGKLLLLSFSDTLGWTSRMSSEPGHGWQHHAYWLPYVFYECNVWEYFERRFEVMLRGKKFSQAEIDGFYKPAKDFQSLTQEKNCLLLTQSSHETQLRDGCVDVIITDPPYGGNVQYLELSDFYLVWLRRVLKFDISSIVMQEAIETRHQDFPTEKSPEHYRDMLLKIFKECHRVLRRNGWLVMTFHNKEIAVWNSLLLAAHDAGFVLPDKNGIIYQPAIKRYTTTLHQKTAGAMLGDFILSFRRADYPPGQKLVDVKDVEEKLISHIDHAIRYHGGVSLNMIYMQLIPILTNEGLLHRVAQDDLEPILRKRYVESNGKWYFKEDIDEAGNVRPIQLVPSEKRIERLLLSILAGKRQVTLDEIYQGLYINLVNGMTPDSSQVDKVLDQVAEKVPGPGRARWHLKSQVKLFSDKGRSETRQGPIQTRLIEAEKPEELELDENSHHDSIIHQLVKMGFAGGFEVHVGATEQRKNLDFRRSSRPMGDNTEFGISPEGLRIIQEIDVLWLKGRSIVKAFEVEKSTTIDSGINRFRNLFTELPNLKVEAFILVPDKRFAEGLRKINSPANIREGISSRIREVAFSKLDSAVGF